MTLTHKTAEGPSLWLSSSSTTRHPAAAPNKSKPYTWPMGNGLRVRAKLTTIPEKKNGTAMQIASSPQIQIPVTDALTTGASVICTPRQKKVAIANNALKYDKSYDR